MALSFPWFINPWEGVRSQPDVCANEPFVALWAVVAAAFAVDPMLLNDLPVFVDERDDGPFDGPNGGTHLRRIGSG